MEYGELPKLVRDKIPEIAEENGDNPEYEKIKGQELEEKVLDKICEEAIELHEDGEPEELADLVEVINKFIEISNFDREKIEHLREKKNKERGSFKQNYILKTTEHQE